MSLDRLVSGVRGEEVHVRALPAGRLSVTVLDPGPGPASDLDVVHAWVTQPRARFWGLGDLTREELAETYAFVDSLPSHHAFLLRWDGSPFALLQTYAPEHDPVGRCYDVADGDVGIHLLLGEPRPGPPVWALVSVVLHELVAGRPGARRVVAEPDVRNRAALARAEATGFEPGPVIHLPDKAARLAFLPAGRAARNAAAALVELGVR